MVVLVRAEPRPTLPGHVEILIDDKAYLVGEMHPVTFRILRHLPQKPGHDGAVVTHGAALRHTAEQAPAIVVDDVELWDQMAAELV